MESRTTPSGNAGSEAAVGLRARITPGKPQPSLTQDIASCRCTEPVRAGLHLLNGDWDRAHKVAQEIETPLGAYWHALVHRHEPDFPNSKYWLAQAGRNPVHAQLAEAARTMGHEDVLRNGNWDPNAFTDRFAAPEREDWVEKLDILEMQLLLEYCLAQSA